MPNFLLMDIHDVEAAAYLSKIITDSFCGNTENVSDLS